MAQCTPALWERIAAQLALLAALLSACSPGPRPIQLGCPEPPPDVVREYRAAEVEAKLPVLKEVLLASMTTAEKHQRIRQELPGTQWFEIVEYRLCMARRRGDISAEDYTRMLQQLIKVRAEQGASSESPCQRYPDGPLTIQVAAKHAGWRRDVRVSPESSVAFLIDKCVCIADLRTDVEVGALHPLKMRWVLVDAGQLDAWAALAQDVQQSAYALLDSAGTAKVVYHSNISLTEAGIAGGEVFYIVGGPLSPREIPTLRSAH